MYLNINHVFCHYLKVKERRPFEGQDFTSNRNREWPSSIMASTRQTKIFVNILDTFSAMLVVSNYETNSTGMNHMSDPLRTSMISNGQLFTSHIDTDRLVTQEINDVGVFGSRENDWNLDQVYVLS